MPRAIGVCVVRYDRLVRVFQGQVQRRVIKSPIPNQQKEGASVRTHEKSKAKPEQLVERFVSLKRGLGCRYPWNC